MKIGYARVSKSDGSQVHDLQMDALKAAGVAEDAIHVDTASGKRDDRPGLAACLKHLREGDVLVTWRLDRLGRDLRHLLDIVADLDKRGVGLQTLTGVQVDTTSPTGKLIFTVFAALAEYERAQLVERTKAGLSAARARGKNGGRPKTMTKAKLKVAQAAMSNKDTDATMLAKELGVSRTTLYRHVGPDGTLRPDGVSLMAGK
jgi:DNA invertase Pin-like site-specific DNA recombinase